ncbi:MULTISPECIES: 2-amino-4-hydroxy-6-hydroxymethyldihydropteridine diphosphokinase [unclassified Methylophaga]|mgnify:CR=1 FL=1|jgi:2-amino-4-hydroxy-6-hydroxymethyldihydropteridine diphosphokinase|uniref:2-amino-4-hydroxy-6- hydroxymethyldihydropteridine diphosphokinase n=1 Tax=unclassified Methylophaga TaxID=2629249 RepID=UPI000C97E8BD|nr:MULTISPECIES: 2-amino-4-hydroxy-6-hydroxymethyldihydropteridine diphosphokinase [unclassified Methylophaga]MAK66594.1 2-amino-4-hydroxy-6-hydroxymethyldihydropteridine diphosphokinase [Methylophaga sp.]MAY17528.1 2-amino-4-hydroxy-6-hydroxymethyldihydropteridine diphosphokinase [Methylophaga sp.]HAO24281.1 2-amino-4-hydroxy-6-hydroxymethyldihydropteridine diphosphokinase [Methylophaga sp.]HCD04034.1 2-amino-4-hydroxy-6-hydroxymethyldihydropteridine diphosphokinase [Methylophaga sp.]|tara:strand:+ start:18297 stop:18785 length:489 start_codon:yes stop_codon:yes gene_type:complete
MLVYIGLGSNLENPLQQIKTAINDLQAIAEITIVSVSSLYQSPPMGPADQPDYINAVLALKTILNPHQLLDVLQSVEQLHGRERKRHWGERTLDLDILLYGDQILDDERLKIPHPGMHERAFVLYPLAEIAPDVEIPGIGNLQEILPLCPQGDLQQVEYTSL